MLLGEKKKANGYCHFTVFVMNQTVCLCRILLGKLFLQGKIFCCMEKKTGVNAASGTGGGRTAPPSPVLLSKAQVATLLSDCQN